MSMHAEHPSANDEQPPDGPQNRNRRTEPTRPLSVYSAELLGSDPELTILHAGERYRLRRSLSGRLELIGPDALPQHTLHPTHRR
ncbi:hemin uptake protein HemP [Thiorhodococcus fuscus]|uniref:Hemin uptake protein HemP n=1 Tax=Thiorhodococcus fuscus TaxID=527200 RepID=A0ABW4Y345_9GAMM